MSSQVHVHKQALANLKAAILAFRVSAGEQLSALDVQLKRELALFGQALERTQVEVRQGQERVRQLTQAGSRSDERALREATQRLHQAEERLSLVRRSTCELEQAIQTYTRQAHNLYHHLEHEAPKAAAVLSRKIAGLERYEALKAVTDTSQVAAVPDPDPATSAASQPLASRWLDHLIWIPSRYWGTTLEVTMLGIATMAWLNQMPPLNPQDFPQYYQQLVAQQSSEEIPAPYQQLNDQLGLQGAQRKEAQAQGRTDEATTSAGTDPPKL